MINFRSISILCSALLCLNILCSAQSDETTYDFLRLPYSTRSIGLGGKHNILSVDEPGMWTHNPALLHDTLSTSVSIDAAPLTDGIWTGQAAYAHNINRIGMVGVAFQHIGYGSIEAADQWGSSLGSKSAAENALLLTYSKRLAPNISMGATLKPVWSNLMGYSSFGLSVDFGLAFRTSDRRISAALTINNVGGQLSAYDADGSTSRHTLRPQVSMSCAYSPLKAPFHIILTVKDFRKWDLTPEGEKKIVFGDCLLRHCILGIEFQPAKAFYVSVGYDQRKRRELRLSSVGGTAGLSWGIGLHLAKRFDIKYAMSRYHLAGTTNSIGFSMKLQ